MGTKHPCVLFHTRNKGALVPSNDLCLRSPDLGYTSVVLRLWILLLFMFHVNLVFIIFFVCSLQLCGHLLGKG